jgi:hypothetical protein
MAKIRAAAATQNSGPPTSFGQIFRANYYRNVGSCNSTVEINPRYAMGSAFRMTISRTHNPESLSLQHCGPHLAIREQEFLCGDGRGCGLAIRVQNPHFGLHWFNRQRFGPIEQLV